jgi:hypothetical protein
MYDPRTTALQYSVSIRRDFVVSTALLLGSTPFTLKQNAELEAALAATIAFHSHVAIFWWADGVQRSGAPESICKTIHVV